MMKLSSPYQVICFGEVLWDILPSGPLPGGAPVNVAFHLKKSGSHPAIITKVGHDNYGKELINIFAKSGLSTDLFQVDQDHATGLVYAHPNEHHEVAYDIVLPSAWDFIEWKSEFSGLLQEAEFFVFGSLASRSQVSRDTLMQCLEAARTRVLDINLRPPHFRRTQIESLLQQTDVLKMNLAELEGIAGWFGSFTNTEDGVKLMQDRFQIDTVIVTMGGDGALVNEKGTIHRHPGFKVTVADTIGSGDAFLAGFLHQLLQDAPVEQALNFACAIGAFMATQRGACPAYEIAQITELIQAGSGTSGTPADLNQDHSV